MNELLVYMGLLIVAVIEIVTGVAIYLATARKGEIEKLKEEFNNHLKGLESRLCGKLNDLKEWIEKVDDKVYNIVLRLEDEKK